MPLARVKAPDTTLVIFGIIVVAAVLTWIVPSGTYDRTELVVDGAGTRQVVVPGSFRYVTRESRGALGSLAHSLGMIFKAPILGFVDPDAAPIIAFVLLIGGAFAVLQQTRAVDAGLHVLVSASHQSRIVERLLVPIFITLFSLGGAVFGMAEETIPFVLIFVPLALALGYDSLTGVAIPFMGSAAGFAAAFFNPFTVGVAQGIAGLPPFSGASFRVGLWLLTTTLVIAFVMQHAQRVRRDPKRSRTYATDEVKRQAGIHVTGAGAGLTARQKAVLGTFFAGIGLLVWGVLPPGQGGFGWYIVEIAALFVALGAVIGMIGGLGAGGTAGAFIHGIQTLAPTAVIIGLARGILVVLQDGQTIDTILYVMVSALEGTSSAIAAMTMFGTQTVINFFIPSGSGQAALTMPLMAPLSDLVGVTRQTAVLAFQMGDGFTNMIIPTSAVLMGVLTLAEIPWTVWAKWILPLQVLLFALGLVVLAVAVYVGYGA